MIIHSYLIKLIGFYEFIHYHLPQINLMNYSLTFLSKINQLMIDLFIMVIQS